MCLKQVEARDVTKTRNGARLRLGLIFEVKMMSRLTWPMGEGEPLAK